MALVVKNLPVNAADIRDAGSIPGSGRSPGEGNGNPLPYSCLEKEMATHSHILVWRIPMTEESGGLYIVHGVMDMAEATYHARTTTYSITTRLFSPFPEIHSHALSKLLSSFSVNFSFPIASPECSLHAQVTQESRAS